MIVYAPVVLLLFLAIDVTLAAGPNDDNSHKSRRHRRRSKRELTTPRRHNNSERERTTPFYEQLWRTTEDQLEEGPLTQLQIRQRYSKRKVAEVYAKPIVHPEEQTSVRYEIVNIDMKEYRKLCRSNQYCEIHNYDKIENFGEASDLASDAATAKPLKYTVCHNIPLEKQNGDIFSLWLHGDSPGAVARESQLRTEMSDEEMQEHAGKWYKPKKLQPFPALFAMVCGRFSAESESLAYEVSVQKKFLKIGTVNTSVFLRTGKFRGDLDQCAMLEYGNDQICLVLCPSADRIHNESIWKWKQNVKTFELQTLIPTTVKWESYENHFVCGTMMAVNDQLFTSFQAELQNNNKLFLAGFHYWYDKFSTETSKTYYLSCWLDSPLSGVEPTSYEITPHGSKLGFTQIEKFYAVFLKKGVKVPHIAGVLLMTRATAMSTTENYICAVLMDK